MGVSISQMLGMLEAAIAEAEANPSSRFRRRRERTIVLHLRAPVVLGQRGQRAGVDDERVPMYGYSLAQARAMRETIYEAARADLEAMEQAEGH